MLRIAVALQILPAIILIVYGLVKQKRWQPYFDMLLMALPAILFYGMLMGNLPTGPFEWYFYNDSCFRSGNFAVLSLIQVKKYSRRVDKSWN
ncbi:MAG: hypothetical protein KAV25_07755 [Methanophagales archaeon]|nr:hypothetical protein [Methanophagales archaeon]